MRHVVLLFAVLILASCQCPKKESSVMSPKPPAERQHPHLYFGSEDMAALREKMNNPLYAADWQSIRRQAEAAMSGPTIPAGNRDDALAQASSAAAHCALVYRLTGEAAFGRRAREIIDAILATDGWTGGFLGQKGGVAFHLRTAGLCQNLALAYDMLAPDMTAQQKKHFADVCWEKALRSYIAECKDSRNPYLYGTRTMNWLAVLSAGAGTLFIALDGDARDFSADIEIARAHTLRFIEWADDDGSALEHGGYWTYGMGNALHLMAALERNGWPRIMHQASQKLERSAYPIMYGCIGGKNIANFCDDSYGPLGGARDNALFLAARFHDSTIQWFANQLPPAGPLGFVTGDPGLAATPPDGLPTCMMFARTGIAIFRDSMTDPDARFLGLKAGRGRGMIYDDPHCQFDLNSILLDAFGTTLLADPGYGHDWTGPLSTNDPKHPYNSTPPHNTLLVNGEGQLDKYSPLAHLSDLSPSADIDYVVSRLEQGYGPQLKRFDRHVYFVGNKYFVVLDDIELTSPATLTWNFHALKDATLAASPAMITHGQAQLQLLPQSSTALSCSVQSDHVLPRLQWQTTAPVAAARVAFLLVPQRIASPLKAPSLTINSDAMELNDGQRTYRLPIVAHRSPLNSSMTIRRQKVAQ